MLQHRREYHIFVENITHFQKCIAGLQFVEIKGCVQTVFQLSIMRVESDNLYYITVA
jgi:hypothetical protein